MVKRIDDFNAEERVGIKLLENSVFFLTGDISEENINECIKWVVYENLDTREKKILTLYVNTYGGDLYQAFALIDIMRTSQHTIRTIGVGSVMSAGFLIFASGKKQERYIAQNAGIMCHQFSESMENKYHDMKAAFKETDNSNTKMLEILVAATGKSAAVIRKKLLPPSDVYLTAEEMVEIGAADYILQ